MAHASQSTRRGASKTIHSRGNLPRAAISYLVVRFSPTQKETLMSGRNGGMSALELELEEDGEISAQGDEELDDAELEGDEGELEDDESDDMEMGDEGELDDAETADDSELEDDELAEPDQHGFVE